jgi:hypothetical protein
MDWEFGVNQEDVCPQSNLPAFPVSNRIPGVQPNRLENLDDLLAQAEHYANYSMRNIGRLPPTLFLIGSEGLVMFTPESLADEGDKDDFATTARLMCIAHAATAFRPATAPENGSSSAVRRSGSCRLLFFPICVNPCPLRLRVEESRRKNKRSQRTGRPGCNQM